MKATSNGTGAAAPRNVIRLVTQPRKPAAPSVNADTVDALILLLQAAQRGEIVGLAYAAMLPQPEDRHWSYIIDTAGEAMHYPTFVRGMLRSLDDQVAATPGQRGDAP